MPEELFTSIETPSRSTVDIRTPGPSTKGDQGMQMRQTIKAICIAEDRNTQERIESQFLNSIQNLSVLVTEQAAQLSRTNELVSELRSQVQAAQAPPAQPAMAGEEGNIVRDVQTLRTDVNSLLERRLQQARPGATPPHSRHETEEVGGLHPDEEQISINEALTRIAKRMSRLEAASAERNAGMADAAYAEHAAHEEPPDRRRHSRRNSRRKHRSKRSSRRKRSRHRDVHHTSSEDDLSESRDEDRESQDSLGSSSSSDADAVIAVPFSLRRKGPRYPGLKEIKPNDPRFDRLMSYRYYRLHLTAHSRSGRDTGKARDHIKRMQLTIKHPFDGSDPVRIFEFLTRFVLEADTLQMTEAQAFLALPYFLNGTAETQFRAAQNASYATAGGVTNWSTAVQYLLRTYATPNALREAVADLRSLRQNAGESELDFSMRLNKALYRCGNVFPPDEQMTLFIDGLSPVIRTLVARFRESHPRRELSYERIVQFARDEGDAYRARARPGGKTLLRPDPGLKRDRVQFAESSLEERHRSPSGHQPRHGDVDNLNLIQVGAGPSDLTSDLPTTLDGSHDQLCEPYNPKLYGERPRVAAPPVPYMGRGTYVARGRPGWMARAGPAPRAHQSDKAVCYTCYGKGHYSAECVLPLRELSTVIRNYESFSEIEKATVPVNGYHRARAQFRPDGTYVDPASEAHAQPRQPPLPRPAAAELHPAALQADEPEKAKN